MKIATITCHDVYNYGASLQAYALQEYCRSLGADYEIIDYMPPYESGHYKIWKVNNARFDKPVIKQLYLLAKLRGRLIALKRKKKFDEFTAKYLHVSPRRYDSNEMLKNEGPYADLYMAGSDQIWNTLFSNGKDPVFYLDFVKGDVRKVSYAASFATDRIHDGYEDFVGEKLKNFDAISVRESSALKLLDELGRHDGKLVCDPVFLLSEEEWRNLMPDDNSPKEDYILVYDCEKSLKLRKITEELKRKTGLKVYSISSTYGLYADKDFSLEGPLEFLKLLFGARYVVANSFHALAFSIIFKKDFFIINRSEGINPRMRDFLDYLHLPSRLINSPKKVTLEKISYKNVTPLLNSLIEDSKNFIAEQIEKTK